MQNQYQIKAFNDQGKHVPLVLREIDLLIISRATDRSINFFELWEEFSQRFNMSPMEVMDAVVKMLAAIKFHPELESIQVANEEYTIEEVIEALQKFTSGSEESLVNIMLDTASSESLVETFRTSYSHPLYKTGITLRELEVIEGMVSGLSNGQLAVSLGISLQTVKNHINSIFAKTGVRTRTEVVTIAMNWLVDRALSREI